MKKITSFTIDSSPVKGGGDFRAYTVKGEPRSAFSMLIVNNAGNFYNFPENTVVSEEEGIVTPAGSFSSTPVRLSTKTIGNSGVYNGTIDFPAASDDKYTIVLQAETYLNTKFDENLSLNAVYHAAEITQFADTTVTFAVASTGSPGTYTANPPATSHVSSGPSTSVTNKKFAQLISFSKTVELGSSQFVIARQPVINDFYFTTTKDTFSAGSGKILELKDVSGLSLGMAVSGTGIAANSTITDIKLGYKDENKSVATKAVYTIPKDIDLVDGIQSITDSKGGTITLSEDTTSQAVDRTITFKGFGNGGSRDFNNTMFTVKNFNLTIAPVTTTLDVAASDTQTIKVVSTAGVKVADTTIMSGIGVVGTPHIDGLTTDDFVTVSSNQTIENLQTVTFTGSSRSATITADIEIEKYGKDDITLTLELDNILTVG